MTEDKPDEMGGMPQQPNLSSPTAEPQHLKKNEQENMIVQFNNELSAAGRKLRVLEERYANLRKKTQITDQNMLDNYKKLNTEIRLINKDITELKNQFTEAGKKLEQLWVEVGMTARKNDLKMLEKYIMMWNPVRFLTEKQARKLIEEYKK